MKPVTRTELKRFLGQLSRDQFINQMLDLWSSFAPVKDYYQAKVRPENDETVREKYRKVITHEFYPVHGYGKLKLSVARKAVSDYKKVAASANGVADLMLFYVEMGVRFTNDFGDIDEGFYLSMERMYASALKWIRKHGLEQDFEERCAKVVENTRGIGWGFHDALSHAYFEYYDPPDAE